MFRRQSHKMRSSILLVLMAVAICPARAEPSIARIWNDEAMNAIRIDLPRPPVHARNLFHLSVAMYDAWAAFDPVAEGYLFKEKIDPLPSNVTSARVEAISYAAYRVLRQRYARSVSSNITFAALASRMNVLGFPTNLTATAGDAPYAIGNRVAQTVLTNAWFDGASESVNYRFSFTPANPPLAVKFAGNTMDDPNRWQPLSLDESTSQNGIPDPQAWQTNVCPHWGRVTPFALMRLQTNAVYEDAGKPPRLFEETEAEFKAQMVEVVRLASWLDPDDGEMIDISPGAIGNNSLGKNDGTGHPVNPVTGLPYASNVVRRGDFGRVLAEYWADGPQSETPPGHWNVIAGAVSDAMTNKLIAGVTPVADDLEWDVKMYFGLNGATHDAAVAAWNHKGVYDSVRPISAIRWLCAQGQSSDPFGPAYHTNGIPLVPGLVEVITAESSAPGQRHALFNTNIGEIALYTWPGQPADPTNTFSGAQWTRGLAWQPYQKNTFVTPPFAGMISGHSTYSRAAAEFLAAFTGSPYVPGGLGEFVAGEGAYLTFEYGPVEETRIQWATYYDAADLAGISRLWGGIHIAADDFCGRRTGARIGRAAYDLAMQYFSGVDLPHPLVPATFTFTNDLLLVTWPAKTGRMYRIECSTNGVDYAPCSTTLVASAISMTWTNDSPSAGLQVHRVVAAP